MSGLTIKKTSWVILSFLCIWTVITILAVTWGIWINLPDDTHINYGFPLTWSKHTLSTIAGSVDLWDVNISPLLMDLLFWLGLMLIAAYIILLKKPVQE